MSKSWQIGSDQLRLADIRQLLSENFQLSLTEDAWNKVDRCRNFLDDKLANSDDLFYGINTGFGSLCNVRISREQIEELQHNLLMSHASGIGDEVPPEIVRLMLFLKIKSLALGHSGIHPDTLDRLIYFYNNDILPVVYQQGSLGASGDLAPLAHLGLPLIGLGEVYAGGKKKAAAAVLQEHDLSPLQLKSKEGIALINGTQFMLAYGAWCLVKAQRLAELGDLISAISLEVFNCKTEPFEPLIHEIRPFEGQKTVAANIRKYIGNSELSKVYKQSVQDPYSFRCIPQVHGASRGALAHVTQVMETEINSVTDNPNLFPDAGWVLSGGNFHGQPLALALDYFCMAVAELGNISERRGYKLLSGERGLPPFLVNNPGLHSGLMIPQYTAASIVSQNKQLCTPASVDSITSSNGQEDHVSMGANAATKAYQVVNNLEKILAIEFLIAAQALHFRRPSRSSEIIESVVAEYRKEVSFNDKDRVLHHDIVKTISFLKTLDLEQSA